MLYSEFRDGNVPAYCGRLPVFKEAVGLVPHGVIKVFLRSDTCRVCNRVVAVLR